MIILGLSQKWQSFRKVMVTVRMDWEKQGAEADALLLSNACRQTSDPVNQVTQNSKPGNAAPNECKVTYHSTRFR